MDNIPESRQQPAQNVLDCREPRFSFDAELTEWATTSTGMTPHRSVATEYDNFGVPLPVRKRRMECTGRPVYSYHPSKNRNSGRGTCAVCGMLTHIYCVHCHHFTCFQAREKVLLNQQAGILYSTRFDLNGDESEVFFKQFCYHIWHKPGLDREAQQKRSHKELEGQSTPTAASATPSGRLETVPERHEEDDGDAAITEPQQKRSHEELDGQSTPQAASATPTGIFKTVTETHTEDDGDAAITAPQQKRSHEESLEGQSTPTADGATPTGRLETVPETHTVDARDAVTGWRQWREADEKYHLMCHINQQLTKTLGYLEDLRIP